MRKIMATKTDKKRWAYCVKVRKLTAIFLLLAGLVNAATYYVSPDANGSGDGSQNMPWTILQACNALASGASPYLQPGDKVMIKAGTHTLTAAPSNGAYDGSITNSILFVGCDSSWNEKSPTYNSTTKRYDYTDCAQINTASYGITFLNSDYINYKYLYFYSATGRNGVLLSTGTGGLVYRCKFQNGNSSVSAGGLSAGAHNRVIECEFGVTGTNAVYAAMLGSNSQFYGCVVYDSPTVGLAIGSTSCRISNCLIFGVDGYCISNTSSGGSFGLIERCTLIGGTYGVYFADVAWTGSQHIIDCIITGTSTRSVYYSNAIGSRLFAINNHIYNNTNNAISWSGELIEIGTITTNTSDFRDSANADYRLAYTAPALNAGVMGNSIGALGPEGLPAPSAVWSNSSIMGTQGTLTLPTAAQVLYNVLFGPDSGTQGNFYVPAKADVKLGVTFGNDNTEFTGEYVGSGSGSTGKQQMPIQRHGY